MGRRPKNRLPQRRLAREMRVALDRSLYDKRAERTVERLVRENPASAFSTHVLYNIGDARARHLFFLCRKHNLPAASLASLPIRRDALVGPVTG